MAIVRTAHGWDSDTNAASIDWGTAENVANADRNRALQREGLTSRENMSAADLAAQASRQITGTESAERIAEIQAQAMRDAARIRAGGGYNKGGPVVEVGYKHSNNPMYAKFASTMDSSLLAKSRGRK